MKRTPYRAATVTIELRVSRSRPWSGGTHNPDAKRYMICGRVQCECKRTSSTSWTNVNPPGEGRAANPSDTSTAVWVPTGRHSRPDVDVETSAVKGSSHPAATSLAVGAAWLATAIIATGEVETATSDDDVHVSPPTPTSRARRDPEKGRGSVTLPLAAPPPLCVQRHQTASLGGWQELSGVKPVRRERSEFFLLNGRLMAGRGSHGDRTTLPGLDQRWPTR